MALFLGFRPLCELRHIVVAKGDFHQNIHTCRVIFQTLQVLQIIPLNFSTHRLQLLNCNVLAGPRAPDIQPRQLLSLDLSL